MGKYTDLDLSKANGNMNDGRFFKYFEQRNFDYKY